MIERKRSWGLHDLTILSQCEIWVPVQEFSVYVTDCSSKASFDLQSQRYAEELGWFHWFQIPLSNSSILKMAFLNASSRSLPAGNWCRRLPDLSRPGGRMNRSSSLSNICLRSLSWESGQCARTPLKVLIFFQSSIHKPIVFFLGTEAPSRHLWRLCTQDSSQPLSIPGYTLPRLRRALRCWPTFWFGGLESRLGAQSIL